jgi:hypothetical protein
MTGTAPPFPLPLNLLGLLWPHPQPRPPRHTKLTPRLKAAGPQRITLLTGLLKFSTADMARQDFHHLYESEVSAMDVHCLVPLNGLPQRDFISSPDCRPPHTTIVCPILTDHIALSKPTTSTSAFIYAQSSAVLGY